MVNYILVFNSNAFSNIVFESCDRKEREEGWEEGWEGEEVNLLLKKTRKLGIFHDVFVHIVNSPLFIVTLRS